jgi:hypothetical protein
LGSVGDANAVVAIRPAATRAKRKERINILLNMERRTNVRLSPCRRESSRIFGGNRPGGEDDGSGQSG